MEHTPANLIPVPALPVVAARALPTVEGLANSGGIMFGTSANDCIAYEVGLASERPVLIYKQIVRKTIPTM